MYYVPYCPMCTPKAKIKKNLMQSIDYIEHKHKIKTRDYGLTQRGIDSSTRANSVSLNVDHAERWKNAFCPIPAEFMKDPLPNHRFNQAGMDWYKTPAGRATHTARDQAYKKAPDGEKMEIPYLDWWHMFVDVYEFSNDSWITINWQDVYDSCKEDWQREITKLFVDEFGKRDIRIRISW